MKTTYRFRWSDNVLPKSDNTIVDVTFEKGVVTETSVVQLGAYKVDHLLGKEIGYFERALEYDPTGSHPEMYFHVLKNGRWESEL